MDFSEHQQKQRYPFRQRKPISLHPYTQNVWVRPETLPSYKVDIAILREPIVEVEQESERKRRRLDKYESDSDRELYGGLEVDEESSADELEAFFYRPPLSKKISRNDSQIDQVITTEPLIHNPPELATTLYPPIIPSESKEGGWYIKPGFLNELLSNPFTLEPPNSPPLVPINCDFLDQQIIWSRENSKIICRAIDEFSAQLLTMANLNKCWEFLTSTTSWISRYLGVLGLDQQLSLCESVLGLIKVLSQALLSPTSSGSCSPSTLIKLSVLYGFDWSCRILVAFYELNSPLKDDQFTEFIQNLTTYVSSLILSNTRSLKPANEAESNLDLELIASFVQVEMKGYTKFFTDDSRSDGLLNVLHADLIKLSTHPSYQLKQTKFVQKIVSLCTYCLDQLDEDELGLKGRRQLWEFVQKVIISTLEADYQVSKICLKQLLQMPLKLFKNWVNQQTDLVKDMILAFYRLIRDHFKVIQNSCPLKRYPHITMAKSDEVDKNFIAEFIIFTFQFKTNVPFDTSKFAQEFDWVFYLKEEMETTMESCSDAFRFQLCWWIVCDQGSRIQELVPRCNTIQYGILLLQGLSKYITLLDSNLVASVLVSLIKLLLQDLQDSLQVKDWALLPDLFSSSIEISQPDRFNNTEGKQIWKARQREIIYLLEAILSQLNSSLIELETLKKVLSFNATVLMQLLDLHSSSEVKTRSLTLLNDILSHDLSSLQEESVFSEQVKNTVLPGIKSFIIEHFSLDKEAGGGSNSGEKLSLKAMQVYIACAEYLVRHKHLKWENFVLEHGKHSLALAAATASGQVGKFILTIQFSERLLKSSLFNILDFEHYFFSLWLECLTFPDWSLVEPLMREIQSNAHKSASFYFLEKVDIYHVATPKELRLLLLREVTKFQAKHSKKDFIKLISSIITNFKHHIENYLFNTNIDDYKNCLEDYLAHLMRSYPYLLVEKDGDFTSAFCLIPYLSSRITHEIRAKRIRNIAIHNNSSSFSSPTLKGLLTAMLIDEEVGIKLCSGYLTIPIHNERLKTFRMFLYDQIAIPILFNAYQVGYKRGVLRLLKFLAKRIKDLEELAIIRRAGLYLFSTNQELYQKEVLKDFLELMIDFPPSLIYHQGKEESLEEQAWEIIYCLIWGGYEETTCLPLPPPPPPPPPPTSSASGFVDQASSPVSTAVTINMVYKDGEREGDILRLWFKYTASRIAYQKVKLLVWSSLPDWKRTISKSSLLLRAIYAEFLFEIGVMGSSYFFA